MAEKVYTGRDGRLVLRTTTAGTTVDTDLAKVQNWSLSAELELLETTTLGDVARSYVPGVKSYSGSCSLLYYQDGAASPRNDASTLLRTIINNGGIANNATTLLVLRFFDPTTQPNNKEVPLTCFINSAQIGASVGEIATAQISFTVTGDLAATGITI
jgi:hypothetical protein